MYEFSNTDPSFAVVQTKCFVWGDPEMETKHAFYATHAKHLKSFSRHIPIYIFLEHFQQGEADPNISLIKVLIPNMTMSKHRFVYSQQLMGLKWT